MNSYPDIHPYLKKRRETSSGFKRWILSFLPLYFVLQLKSELGILKARLSSFSTPSRLKSIQGALVNIGCGTHGKDGWINIDAFPGPSVNCVFDCRKSLPLPNGSTRGIFSEHFFEHIDYTEEVPYFLAECFRVLEPGGVLRIIVPDAGRFVRAYCSEGWQELIHLRELDNNLYDKYTGCRYNTKMELLNEIFRQAYTHKFAYDSETLCAALRAHGFINVKEQQFGNSYLPELCIDQPERQHESLYVEGVHP